MVPGIDQDAPITLQFAAEKFFPDGTMTVRTLRAERDRGRLETWLIGRREYTSFSAMRLMLELCRTEPKKRAAPKSEACLLAPMPGSALRSLERLRKRIDEQKLAERRERKARGNVKP